MTDSNVTIVDRARKPLSVGQVVRVQHCVGPYGQTDIVEGKIEALHPELRGATLRLTKPTTTRASHDAPRRLVSVGEQFYVALPGEWDGQVYLCSRVFDDFEHGHETWAEIVEEVQADNQARQNPEPR
jgi:hypothetical protein